MVDQSELAWRVLSRLHGADLVYTPMINGRLRRIREYVRSCADESQLLSLLFPAHMFQPSIHPAYCHEQFDLTSGEEGNAMLDRPLIAQFCANDPQEFYQGALRLASAGVVDAVDLNLGCPQGIAKRGHYGAFLMEDWGLIERMIQHLNRDLPVPVTAKFRVYDSTEKTIQYAKMLENAGAQLLTCKSVLNVCCVHRKQNLIDR